MGGQRQWTARAVPAVAPPCSETGGWDNALRCSAEPSNCCSNCCFFPIGSCKGLFQRSPCGLRDAVIAAAAAAPKFLPSWRGEKEERPANVAT
eukprot:365987-Chlamydomonas_euryale.AAC.16